MTDVYLNNSALSLYKYISSVFCPYLPPSTKSADNGSLFISDSLFQQKMLYSEFSHISLKGLN